ncbi:MAG: hypothetical protein HUJ51_02215 [Eggerthellaceae bacterium]|nr:hypothetical protein [Eggerthellaceae bacterium]
MSEETTRGTPWKSKTPNFKGNYTQAYFQRLKACIECGIVRVCSVDTAELVMINEERINNVNSRNRACHDSYGVGKKLCPG